MTGIAAKSCFLWHGAARTERRPPSRFAWVLSSLAGIAIVAFGSSAILASFGASRLGRRWGISGRETRIVATQASLLAISDAPPAFIAHRARRAPVPLTLLRFARFQAAWRQASLPQQFLYFLPLPQGQGSFLPTFFSTRLGPAGPPACCACSRFVSFTSATCLRSCGTLMRA